MNIRETVICLAVMMLQAQKANLTGTEIRWIRANQLGWPDILSDDAEIGCRFQLPTQKP